MAFDPLVFAAVVCAAVMAGGVVLYRRRHTVNHGNYTKLANTFVAWLSDLHKYGHDFDGQSAQDAYVLYADSLREIDSLEYFWTAVRNEDTREQLITMFELHPSGAHRILRAGEKLYLLTGP